MKPAVVVYSLLLGHLLGQFHAENDNGRRTPEPALEPAPMNRSSSSGFEYELA
jgi:hypothetical protein